MNRWTRYAIASAMILFWSATAGAWIRMEYEDMAVVDRSEAIVVGRLDKDSIKYVPRGDNGGGASWEYHATLAVSETLKGSLKDKQIAIVINYGLDPLLGGIGMRPNKALYPGPAPAGFTPDRIDIIDAGNSVLIAQPVLENAQKNNLWFLRHLGGELGREQGKGDWGILDPEDVQPLKFKDYFKSLLSNDVEKEIDRLLTDPDEAVCFRALRYLAARHRSEDAPRIAKLLTAANPKVQVAAAEALAEVGDIAAVPTFRGALKSPHAGVRLMACDFLCRFRDVQSIGAIGKLLPGFDSSQRSRLISDLPRMESREVVEMLLDQLDERLDSNPIPRCSACSVYYTSVKAAEALKELTGVEFPLDTTEARRRWNELKVFPDEVLLRKAMLEDIEALTTPVNYKARWDAYEVLGRLANQHFGSYNAFHGREDFGGWVESQRLWRLWAKDNITRSRLDWIYEGFAQSGITLPRPMDAGGIDKLIAVQEYYGDHGRRRGVQTRPGWNIEGGWVKANFHSCNANWLLERFTGYKVGISPYDHDLRVTTLDADIETIRWATWWKVNRDKVTIQPPPKEKAVTLAMLSKTPSLRLPPPPLTLTIRAKNGVHIFKGKEPLTILIEVKNSSTKDVLIERRPTDLHYTSKTGDGTCGGGTRGGQHKEDFVVIKPGETIAWEQTDTPSADYVTPPRSIEGLYYVLTYCSAGSKFGLHAWRGRLLSNEINVEVKKTPGIGAR